MRKLSKLKLKEFQEMSSSEMKNVVGGYDVTKGTCCAFIPRTNGNAPSLGNYDGHNTTYSAGSISVNSELGYTIHRGISKESALAMVSGIPGAKWACEHCESASWY